MPYGMDVNDRTPKKKDASNTYRVKSGDTLSGIAKKYGTTLANIYKYNPTIAKRKAAGKTTIFANTMIKLPGNTSSETARENRRAAMQGGQYKPVRSENRGMAKPAAKKSAPKRMEARGMGKAAGYAKPRSEARGMGKKVAYKTPSGRKSTRGD